MNWQGGETVDAKLSEFVCCKGSDESLSVRYTGLISSYMAETWETDKNEASNSNAYT